MKSGTTWWWSVLCSHPNVVLADYRLKELHFFAHYGQVEQIDPAIYHRYFPRPSGSIAGEWTPGYMYDFCIPPMLHSVAPDTKLLVLLRDPIERFVSGLTHYGKRGFDLNVILVHHQFSRGLYWLQLQTLLAYFPRQQILVQQYERCVADTRGEARRTFCFLGLNPYAWQSSKRTKRPVNPTLVTSRLLMRRLVTPCATAINLIWPSYWKISQRWMDLCGTPSAHERPGLKLI